MTQRRELIYQTLVNKGTLKQKIFDNTLQTMRLIKQTCQQLTEQMNQKLQNVPESRIQLRFRNLTQFQADLKVAGDLLLFFMHSNIFRFGKQHPATRSQTIKQDPQAAYVGVIHIYNFMADSFKYNRTEDMGLLIRRLFINKDNLLWLEQFTDKGKVKFFVEPVQITPQLIADIIDDAVIFAMNFDLEVLPYQKVNLTTVNEIMEARKIGAPTGKKVGFSYG